MTAKACRPADASSDVRTPANSAGLLVGPRINSAMMFLGNSEPLLSDVVDDPMVRRLMDRDGVQMDSLMSLIGEVRSRLT
jgi:hypothetical protein